MGSGFKDWAAGDVLTAADVDGYLMRQTVMTFADASARDTALSGVLDEGMVAYLEDTNAVTVYNGSAWVAVIDSDVLTVDTANARVGINDSTPSYALDVTGDINATGDLRIGGLTVGTYTDYSASQTYSGLTIGNGTSSVVYCRVNDLVHYKGTFTFGSTSAITGAVDLVPPVSLSGGVFEFNSVCGFYDNNANVFYYGSTIGLFGNIRLTRFLITGGSATASDLSAAAPFTWAVDDFFTWNVVYKAA